MHAIAVIAVIVTITNNLFITPPRWSPTEADASWVAYGNWEGGNPQGVEHTRLAVTNAAGVFSCIDGYYEREEVAHLPYGSSLIDDFPNQRDWRTNAVKYANAIRPQWRFDEPIIYTNGSEIVSNEIRVISDSLRLLSWKDIVSVASNIAGAMCEKRPEYPLQPLPEQTTALYHTGTMSAFGSPWLDASVSQNEKPEFLSGEWFISMSSLGTSYPPSYTADYYESAKKWRDIWPTWGRCEYGDAIYPMATNSFPSISRYYNSPYNRYASSGVFMPDESPVIILFSYPEKWDIVELPDAYVNGWTFTRGFLTTIPLGGEPDKVEFMQSPLSNHPCEGGVFASSAMTNYCSVATNVTRSITNKTVRLDRNRQGAIDMCEAGCEYTYAVAEDESEWIGVKRTVQCRSTFLPLGSVKVVLSKDATEGYHARIVKDESQIFFTEEARTNTISSESFSRERGPYAWAVIDDSFDFDGAFGYVDFGSFSIADRLTERCYTYLSICGEELMEGRTYDFSILNYGLESADELPRLESTIGGYEVIEEGRFVSNPDATIATIETIPSYAGGEYVIEFDGSEFGFASTSFEANDRISTNIIASTMTRTHLPTPPVWTNGWVSYVDDYILQTVTSCNSNGFLRTEGTLYKHFNKGVFPDCEMRLLSIGWKDRQTLDAFREDAYIDLKEQVSNIFNARIGWLTGEVAGYGAEALVNARQYEPSLIIGYFSGIFDWMDYVSIVPSFKTVYPELHARLEMESGFWSYYSVQGGVTNWLDWTALEKVASYSAFLRFYSGSFSLYETEITNRAVSVTSRSAECSRTRWRFRNLTHTEYAEE